MKRRYRYLLLSLSLLWTAAALAANEHQLAPPDALKGGKEFGQGWWDVLDDYAIWGFAIVTLYGWLGGGGPRWIRFGAIGLLVAIIGDDVANWAIG